MSIAEGRAENLRGALFMTLSMAAFVLNDTFMKVAFADFGLYQAIFLRGLVATLAVTLWAWSSGALSRMPARREMRIITLRSLGEIGGTITFLTALVSLSLATVSSIIQVVPLASTLAAAVFLREPVGWQRLLAILIGFGGVMLIVKPGAEGFSTASLLALASVVFIVLRDLATRRLAREVPSLLVSVVTSASITMVGAVGVLATDWRPVTVTNFLPMLGAAGFLVLGYLFSVKAMRVGAVGFVAPFRYSALLWAMVVGVVIFSDVPDWLTLTGSAIVVATGLFTFWREDRLSRAAAA